MKYTVLRILFITVFVAASLSGCGSRKGPGISSPRELLAAGRYTEAKTSAIKGGLSDPSNRAVAALATLAESPVTRSGETAVSILKDGTSEVGAIATAVQMLELIFEMPEPVDPETSLLASETALGTSGLGPLTTTTTSETPSTAAERDLAVAVLERTYLASETPNFPMAPGRILVIWNACYKLAGGMAEPYDEAPAWQLFHSIGGLATLMNRAAPRSDLTNVLAQAAVTVLEKHPEISVPARCDLSSPFDNLRTILAYDRAWQGRMEAAVAGSTGCTRGTYAPKIR
jgi:hypothetical protein